MAPSSGRCFPGKDACLVTGPPGTLRDLAGPSAPALGGAGIGAGGQGERALEQILNLKTADSCFLPSPHRLFLFFFRLFTFFQERGELWNSKALNLSVLPCLAGRHCFSWH